MAPFGSMPWVLAAHASRLTSDARAAAVGAEEVNVPSSAMPMVPALWYSACPPEMTWPAALSEVGDVPFQYSREWRPS